MYHVERNGNAKIILTDLSIKLTRLIHKKVTKWITLPPFYF
jgi:DNA polymerase-3 subunit delta'